MTEREKLADLEPCPFCGKPLGVKRGRINPMARCVTEGCIVASKMSVVNLDDPNDVARWNTRASPPPIPDGRIAREALEPFAKISLARDSDPNAPDMIDAPDLAITPKDVRRARAALALPDQRGSKSEPMTKEQCEAINLRST